MEKIIIRDAVFSDINVMRKLMSDLGYPATEENMKERFINISSKKDYRTLILELNGEGVAMAGLSKNYYYEHDGIYVRILAFVTDKNYRNMGIGKKLLDYIESWAREIHALALILNSGLRDERKAAYEFYQKAGFEIKSSGFVKQI